ncbi:hypothetical protein GQX74_010282 [Glossina fuscipes]|nr:hypothetical protein GQX74_010282 [Glossina fuscipes]
MMCTNNNSQIAMKLEQVKALDVNRISSPHSFHIKESTVVNANAQLSRTRQFNINIDRDHTFTVVKFQTCLPNLKIHQLFTIIGLFTTGSLIFSEIIAHTTSESKAIDLKENLTMTGGGLMLTTTAISTIERRPLLLHVASSAECI